MSQRGSTIKRGRTWTCYWFTTDPATGKRRQHSKGGFARQKDARAHLNSILDKVDRGSWKPDAKITVEQLLIDWLAAKRSEGLRDNTTAMYRNVIDGRLVPHVGGLGLEQLTPARGQELVEKLGSSDGSCLNRGDLSARSVQLAVQVLKAATRWAMETGLVGRDPLVGFKRPRAQVSQAATGAWTAEESRRFLDSASEHRLRFAWWLLLSRGLRRGELGCTTPATPPRRSCSPPGSHRRSSPRSSATPPPVITQVVYQHLMPGQTDAAGERLTALLGGSGTDV